MLDCAVDGKVEAEVTECLGDEDTSTDDVSTSLKLLTNFGGGGGGDGDRGVVALEWSGLHIVRAMSLLEQES